MLGVSVDELEQLGRHERRRVFGGLPVRMADALPRGEDPGVVGWGRAGCEPGALGSQPDLAEVPAIGGIAQIE
jgi:hypothetical protein